MSVKQQILDGVVKLSQSIKAPELKKNEGALYVNVFVWQEIEAIASDALKKAWATAQAKDGVMVDDDDMRALGEGDHIVSESGSFSLVAKVSKPRSTFQKDVFIAEAARRFKTTPAKVLALYEECSKEGKSPLQKRIMEA